MGLQVNPATGARVELPDPLAIMEAEPLVEPFAAFIPDLEGARRQASWLAAGRAGPFLSRLEGRLERDRQRIREYYGALLEETSPARHRIPDDPAKLADKRRAVEAEMQRRLLELDDRYALRLRLDPVALVGLEMPVLQVELEVSRRPEKGAVSVYWNPLRKELEPLSCRGCGANIKAIRFDALLTVRCARLHGK